MIPGLLAAAGYERSDTPYVASDIVDGNWPNTHGDVTQDTFNNITLPGTPSDTRFIVVIGYLLNAPNDDDWTVTGLSLSGVNLTVESLTTFTRPFDASNDFEVIPFVAYGTVPSGTTATQVLTWDNPGNVGVIWHDYIAIDFGVPATATVLTQDVTPNTSTGQLSVEVPSDNTAVFASAYWASDTSTKTDVTWSGTPDDVGVSHSSSAPYGYYYETAIYKNQGAFTLTATPNAYTTGEAGTLVAVIVHYH